MPFGVEKLEGCGYPIMKKFYDVFSCFDGIPAYDGRTDGRTDRRLDGQTSCDSIVRDMHSIAW